MTDWNVPARLLITTNTLAGMFASWAVQQSPYDAPEGLDKAIRDFRSAWPSDEELRPIMPAQYWNSYGELYEALYTLFCETESIRAWNEPKSKHGASIVFSSRYGGPSPDDDFIDLGALANNVAREAWKDALADKAFDDRFSAEWESEHGTAPFKDTPA